MAGISKEEIARIWLSTPGNQFDFAERIADFVINKERKRCVDIVLKKIEHPAGYGGQWEGYGPVTTFRSHGEIAQLIMNP